jgi:hypothetical protein
MTYNRFFAEDCDMSQIVRYWVLVIFFFFNRYWYPLNAELNAFCESPFDSSPSRAYSVAGETGVTTEISLRVFFTSEVGGEVKDANNTARLSADMVAIGFIKDTDFSYLNGS